MNAIKYVLIAAVVAGVAILAWRKLPGLRTSIAGAVDEYGGWTEEARRDDPVGFIEYAQEKLAEDVGSFQESRVQLAEVRRNGEAEMARNQELLDLADELAARFRSSFQAAEASGTWPVEVKGASYTRDTLIEQVESILGEKASYAEVAGIYADVVQAADEQDAELESRIQSTEASLVKLKAQKELVRVQKLSAEADELMAKVQELLGENHRARSALDAGPVRSVEDLLGTAESAPESADAAAALEFLRAD